MKKLLVIISLFSLCSLLSCKSSSGSSAVTKTDSCLNFELTNLDGTINNTMYLQEKDSIKTIINKNDTGKVYICVKNTNTNEISYEGNSSLANDFTFEIDKTGTYDFIIKGDSVTGTINFKKQ